jgi:TorA maturation chaperone TorD
MKPTIDYQYESGWHTPFASIRTDSYVLLAAFLNGPPTQDLLNLGRHLQWNDDIPEKLHLALSAFSQACRRCPAESFAAEFQRLFVGLGRGDLVPYGSWYLEEMIQSAPLAAIRSDLQKLGIVKQTDSFESEDHAGVLCEIMALVSLPSNGVPAVEQADFFERHLTPWMMRFFKDLQSVDHAEFYRSVGVFGSSFLEAESEYLRNICTAAYV